MIRQRYADRASYMDGVEPAVFCLARLQSGIFNKKRQAIESKECGASYETREIKLDVSYVRFRVSMH